MNEWNLNAPHRDLACRMWRAMRAMGAGAVRGVAHARGARARRRAGATAVASGTIRVVSFNVNGARALLRRRPLALDDLCERTGADVLAIQETKLGVDGAGGIAREDAVARGYGARAYVTSEARRGYAGAAIFVRDGFQSTMRTIEATALSKYALSDGEKEVLTRFDLEGRVLTLETDGCFVVSAYVPNSGAELKRLRERTETWERAMRAHLCELKKAKPVIYCGDLNVAHEEIDLWGRHKENAKSAGFTPEERSAMSTLLSECELVDSFRHKHPDKRAYTYWSYRGRARELDRGWRLDYVLVDRRLADSIVDAEIYPDVTGSDHCPVSVTVAL